MDDDSARDQRGAVSGAGRSHGMRFRCKRLVFMALLVACVAGCAPASLAGVALPALDRSDVGEPFNADFLMADPDLEDGTYLSADAVQGFFEKTPYGAPSFLATYADKGARAADLVVTVAAKHRISAIWLLGRLERDGALVAARRYPAEAKQVEFVFSYGCSGRVRCDPTFGGLRAQLDALAGDLRRSLDDVRAAGFSANGFGVGAPGRTLDGVTVTPATAATAALYAVEPLVGGAAGGQEQSWRIYRLYAAYIGYVPSGAPVNDVPVP